MTLATPTLCVGIGGTSVAFHVSDAHLAGIIGERYADFMTRSDAPDCEFDLEVTPQQEEATGTDLSLDADADAAVWLEGKHWIITRGDFRAEFDPSEQRGRIRQSANPYSIDSVLRIVHTLVLAQRGGFLVHAASAIRNGKAFVFAGVSGAGKTTIAGLAPPDATLLTDEISYVRNEGGQYFGYGTPFAGELAKPGGNLRAPVAALYLLSQGAVNRIDEIESPVEAARGLLRNILFFAHDPEMVKAVFESAVDFVQQVPIRRLSFQADERVWELIQ